MNEDQMTTYRYADPKRMEQWEYGFMSHIDYFENEAVYEDYLEVVEEVWVLESRRTIKLGTTSRSCSGCDEDVELDEPINGPVWCDPCEMKRLPNFGPVTETIRLVPLGHEDFDVL